VKSENEQKMTSDHILLFSAKWNLPTCDSLWSDGSHIFCGTNRTNRKI